MDWEDSEGRQNLVRKIGKNVVGKLRVGQIKSSAKGISNRAGNSWDMLAVDTCTVSNQHFGEFPCCHEQR